MSGYSTHILSADGMSLVPTQENHHAIRITGNVIQSSIKVAAYDDVLFTGSEDECKEKLLEFAGAGYGAYDFLGRADYLG